jgi:beta-lactamase superfamily II metal-dependent hydrolase
VPLGTFALVANLGALICGHWFPWATALFNHAAWFLMVAMTWVSDVSTRIPGAYFYVPAPSFAFVLGYYAVVIALLAGFFNTVKRQIFGGAVLVLAAGYGLYVWQLSRHETEITILPINGSRVIYAQDPAGDYLIDCGNEKSVDYTVAPFLRAHGVNHLANLIITEGSVQTAGGAPRIDALFRLQHVFTSSAKSRSGPYRQAMAAFDDPPDSHGSSTPPRHQTVARGVTIGPWQVLHPAADSPARTIDDNALVLLGNFSGTKVLLLSDLSPASQNDLLRQTNTNLHADIVVAGLPTKGEPLSDSLLAAIHPRLIIITDATEPVNRRASPELQDRMDRCGVPVIYTRSANAVTIKARSAGWHVTTMNGLEFKSVSPGS